MSGAVRLVPRRVARPWGGRRLASRFGWGDGGDGPDDGPRVGEWWLCSCHASAVTDVEGAGPLTAWLDGPDAPAGLPSAADFPLLLKFLDSDEVLSVQLHPDDDLARAHGLANGKTEAWHILAAEPGAWLAMGTADGVSSADLLRAVDGGAGDDEVAGLLHRVPARAGDTWLVPAGTIHALGPGVTLFEIQQNSDATWRLYDWGRQPTRELHLEQARAGAKDLPRAVPVRADRGPGAWSGLVCCDAFGLRHARVGADPLPLPSGSTWSTVTALDGAGGLRWNGGEVPLTAGGTALVWGPTELVGEGLVVLHGAPA